MSPRCRYRLELLEFSLKSLCQVGRPVIFNLKSERRGCPIKNPSVSPARFLVLIDYGVLNDGVPSCRSCQLVPGKCDPLRLRIPQLLLVLEDEGMVLTH